MRKLLSTSLLIGCALLTGCESDRITAPVARVEGNQLRLVDGSPFVARGINLQYGDAPSERLAAIAAIATTASNIVRLQARDHTTPDQLARGIATVIEHGMMVMPFYWENGLEGGTGTTCSNAPEALHKATEKWARDWRSVMQRPEFQPYLMLNIANEWGRRVDHAAAPEPMSYDDFIKYYSKSIKRLRKAGYQMPLVIDAPHCGQDYQAFTGGRGRRLVEADPLKNVVLSVHGYWRYRNPNEIDAALAELEAEGVHYLFGEFGNGQFQSTLNGGHAIDVSYLLKRLQELQRGWIAWSWYGNGDLEFQSTLDLSAAVDQVMLSPHGELVVNGPYGLRATARARPRQLIPAADSD